MRGNLAAYPGGAAQPGTSDLNWNAAETIANSVPVAGGAAEQPAGPRREEGRAPARRPFAGARPSRWPSAGQLRS